MGQAKNRDSKANHKTGADYLVIRRSTLTKKWAVDLDLPTGSRRLTVFFDRARAEKDLSDFAAPVFSGYSAASLASESVFVDAVSKYSLDCIAAGWVDDDQCLGLLADEDGGGQTFDCSESAQRRGNAIMREFNLMSDEMWDKATPRRQ